MVTNHLGGIAARKGAIQIEGNKMEIYKLSSDIVHLAYVRIIQLGNANITCHTSNIKKHALSLVISSFNAYRKGKKSMCDIDCDVVIMTWMGNSEEYYYV